MDNKKTTIEISEYLTPYIDNIKQILDEIEDKVKNNIPFTIQILYDDPEEQEIDN